MKIALFSKFPPVPDTYRCVEVPWEALVKDLSTHTRTSCAPCVGHDCQAKKHVGAWAPIELDGEWNDRNTREITAAVFDLDSTPPTTMVSVARAIEDYSWVLHSTHAPDSYRLVMQLSRPLALREWPGFLDKASAYLGIPRTDTRARNASRLYFFPSCSHEAEAVSFVGEGKTLDVDAVLAAAAPPLAVPRAGTASAPPAVGASPPGGAVVSFDLEPWREGLKSLRRGESRELMCRVLKHEPLAQEGERDDSVNRAMSLLASVGPGPMPVELAFSLIEPSLRAMPMGDALEGWDYWKAKALGCYTRACERRAKREAQAAADKAVLLQLAGAEPGRHVEGTDDEWRQRLLVKKNEEGEVVSILSCEANLELILQNDPAWKGTLRWNELRKTIDVFGGPLEGLKVADLEFQTAVWFQRSEYRLMPKPFTCGPALLAVARQNAFDPLADHVRSLKWDGVSRSRTWLVEYLHAEPNPVLMEMGRKWLVSCVARALDPGCKMDTALILTGDYGVRKSSFVQVMAGAFYSNANVDFKSKDSLALAARYWIVEMAEMSGYRKSEQESVKNFLSTPVDTFRPPYGRVLEDFPRRAVFVGSANDDDFLNEPNRREWMLSVPEDIDLKGLRAVRDQLFAEAVAIYDAAKTCPECAKEHPGRCNEHSWWFDKSGEKLMREIAKEFAAPDNTKERILDWWIAKRPDQRPADVRVHDLAADALGLPQEKITTVVLQHVGRVLKELGFVKNRIRRAGVLVWIWRTPTLMAAVPQATRLRPAEEMARIAGP